MKMIFENFTKNIYENNICKMCTFFENQPLSLQILLLSKKSNIK